MFPTRALCVTVLLALCLCGVQPVESAPPLPSIRLPAGQQVGLGTTWIVVAIDEALEGGEDLNGDGDTEDIVLHARNIATGSLTNLGVESRFFLVSGDSLVVALNERDTTDLNGDGDRTDQVLEIHNLETGASFGMGLAVGEWTVIDRWLVFQVVEEAQGEVDLNQDGDVYDRVLHIHDLETGVTTNVGIACEGYFRTNGEWLGFLVSERHEGREDLNGDGDDDDRTVLHLYNFETGELRNLGRATDYLDFHFFGDTLVFNVWELWQGNSDVNGDGDAGDSSLHLYDLRTGLLTNLGIMAYGYRAEGDWLAFRVPEALQAGTDLNGDGDASDWVLHAYNLRTQEMRNIALAGTGFAMVGHYVAAEVPEYAQGLQDLNGDGDLSDTVLMVHDLSTEETSNTQLAVLETRERIVRGFGNHHVRVSGGRIILVVDEEAQGSLDRNGDGDTDDLILHVHDPLKGTTTNLGLAAVDPENAAFCEFALSGRWLAFRTWESLQGGTDLNGDGDAVDAVVHLHDLETGQVFNCEIASPGGGAIFGRWLLYYIDESLQGGQDFNGDGDGFDVLPLLTDLGLPQSLPRFRRGDCNADGAPYGFLTDASYLLRFNFLGGPAPPCPAACDADGDGRITGAVADAVYLLQHGFLGGPPPPAPYPDCGASQRPEDLGLGCDDATSICP